MGRLLHANGITVNKTSETVESAARGATLGLVHIHNAALLFRCLASGALR
jgi:hypothetical protein